MLVSRVIRLVFGVLFFGILFTLMATSEVHAMGRHGGGRSLKEIAREHLPRGLWKRIKFQNLF